MTDDEETKSIDEVQKETDQQLKELSKQLNRLGEKFGGFAESLALPSMTKVLTERFSMEVICPSVRVNKQGERMVIDVLAYASSDINEAYIVEVRTNASEEAIERLRNTLECFRRLFPMHEDKTVYGILAAVDMPDDLRERILKAGFYVARIHDQVFELDVPANFKPRAY